MPEIKVPVWSGSGEDSLPGCKQLDTSLYPSKAEKGLGSSLGYLF